MTELPKTLATDAGRAQADAYANNMLGVKAAYSVPGFVDKAGKFVAIEVLYDPLAENDGDDSRLTVIADARQAGGHDVLIADAGAQGPIIDGVKGRALSDAEKEQAALADACAFNLSEIEDEPFVQLEPLEQRIQRQDEARILRTRRLIVMAITPCENIDSRRATANECLDRLARARGQEREILAAWAAANLRALGYARAAIFSKLGDAAGCKADAVKRLIVRGDAELAVVQREARQTVNRVKRTVKPDLREIEIGSVFDGEASAQAIARLEPDKQRRLMRAIEARFTRSAMAADDKDAEQTRLRPISYGMQRRLVEIGRDDIDTRTLLGRLTIDTAQRLLEVWVSAHADSLSGLPSDENTAAEYAGLLDEVVAQLEGQRRHPIEKKQMRSLALKHIRAAKKVA